MSYVLHDTRRQWSSNVGASVVYTYQGPADAFDAWLPTITPGYSALSWSETMDKWRSVDVTYSAETNQREPEDPDYGLIVRQWTLDPASEDRPLTEHPHILTLWERNHDWPSFVLARVKDWKKKVAAAVESNTTPPAWTEMPYPAGATTEERALAERFAEILKHSDTVPTFETSVYVLRKVESVTSFAVLKASHTNVGKMLTYSSLTTSEPSLPGAILIEAGDLSDLYWLKRAPLVSPVSGGNWQIAQEYYGFADFSRFIYGCAIGEDSGACSGKL